MKTMTHTALMALLVIFGLGLLANAGASEHGIDGLIHPQAGVKPSKDFRGRYPVLIKSLREGQVRSITPENVVSYGYPSIGKYNGQIYWMVPVTFYTAGPDTSYQQISADGRHLPHISRGRPSPSQHATDVYACVRAGRVEHWVYKVSKDPVR